MLLLLLACSATVTDSGSTGLDSGVLVDACDQGDARGAVTGQAACADGRCTLSTGSFWMGEPDSAHPDRCPQRQVTLSAYSIDQTEVTAGAYDSCVDAGACTAVPATCLSGAEVEDPGTVPVLCATHDQASTYCGWAGGRLPTEAEWERAARGDDGAAWPWGVQPPTCNRANFHFSTSYCAQGPLPAGSFPDHASPWGLLDVAGNVWEWTADWYDAGWYRDAPDVDPAGPQQCSLTVDGERGDCTRRVLRGGAWNTTEGTTHTAARSLADPGVVDVNIGFRCAYSTKS